MANLEQKLHSDLLEARAELHSAKDELVSAQRKVDRLNERIDYIGSVLNGREKRDSGSNIHAVGKEGHSTSDWIQLALEESGKELRTAEIAKRALKAGYMAPNPDLFKATVNISSVLQRATKNPNHPVFRKVGRGLFDLTSRRKS